jgi:uncharacterized protein
MTFKRLVLVLLTVAAILLAGISLLGSWQEPQVQGRLELYQTDIVLQAASWEDEASDSLQTASKAILGAKPLEAATKQYEDARKSAQESLTTAKKQPDSPSGVKKRKSSQSVEDLEKLLGELDLRIGVLWAQQGKVESAKLARQESFASWNKVSQNVNLEPALQDTAAVLSGLWSQPPRLLPNAQELIQAKLDGWFRYVSLTKLYQLQQLEDKLTLLQASQQETAQTAAINLALIAALPNLAGLFGILLLLFLVIQRLIKGKQSILSQNSDLTWLTLWDGETILQVFVVGFFLMGQIIVPLLVAGIISFLKIPISGDTRTQAFFILINYVFLSSGALLVLYFSIRRFFPLPEGWFRINFGSGKWIFWGIGGYCVAVPVVLIVSLVNQQIWQGQGGSNPILQLALQNQDSLALGIFFFTAAIAAPLFEEFLFRGFLLPSLTRYLPVWGAIVLSSFLFAAAHLSLSEIIPLFFLGCILGVVYTRSRNLLSSMLLHSLWNSGTLLALFVLGSSNK